MQYLLSRAGRPILKSLAQERTLCAFDFDGTLSPIVKHPNLAGMREKTRMLLARLAAQHPVSLFRDAPGSIFSANWAASKSSA